MELIPIFADFFSIKNYSSEISLKLLEKEIYNYIDKYEDSGNSVSNVGGFQSKNLNFNIIGNQFFGNDYTELPKMLNFLHTGVNDILNRKDGTKLALDSAWININKSSHYNTSHCHPKSVISGVFYINIPNYKDEEEGKLIFERSREFTDYMMYQHLSDIENDLIKHPTMYVKPNSGDAIYFPSYLSHSVKPHFSEENRISIAFNASRY